MRSLLLKVSLLIIMTVTTALAASAQREGFITVEGADLKGRIESAVRQARGARSRFWTAYSFDVRPGFAVDAELQNFRGSVNFVSGTVVSAVTSSGSTVETRNLGVFLLHEPDGGPVSRAEVYNLERVREYSGYPVYWLGRAGNEESLNLLKGLGEASQSAKVAERVAMAIGLHDDARVGAALKALARSSPHQEAKKSAVFWLGQVGGENPFLFELARNDKEGVELRKQAIFAIGISKDAAALSNLQSLYNTVANRELKKQVVFAISRNQSTAEGLDFLIKVAASDPDLETRKDALFWLGQKAGQRSMDVLGNVVSSNDADTELQKHAVFVISRRPKDEAVPRLINIARTHAKAEVRKQAIFWLGRTGDERALEFFKEILSK